MTSVAEPSTPRKRSKWDQERDPELGSPPQPPVKRRQLSIHHADLSPPNASHWKRPAPSVFVPPRTHHPPLTSSRSVYSYEKLNSIEEGSYGVVFRARDKQTGDIVALKKLKLDEEKYGFPITALREINALIVCGHENVVGIREIVVGETLTQVFIVMDFIEHDLKSLLTLMPSPFLQSEIKTLMLQLLSACFPFNLLMNNRGTIKVADFGLARRYGDPIGVGGMTQLVVTLWYRAPEILLGAKTYSTAVDMWSVGCIFAELLLKEPLFQAKTEIELISMIFKLLGPPTNESWPEYSSLPLSKTITPPSPQPHQFRQKFPISAEEALQHPYFSSFPSAAAGERRRKPFNSPTAPARVAGDKLLTDVE
ncbi:Pkinase-domain-containing protein [Russula earlei]|uniref:Pkinase-domain-containing protein n=1 Tax=Russula earlei TaxID=71964 RepID=A0ACC0UNW5_9AGAM|nr:Pkinase-domain-containing protein [Russula earlei]